MISILIPHIHEDCTRLISDLQTLAQREKVTVEILTHSNLPRAANRNFLADQSRGEWLLFLDADAAVPTDFSLRRYEEAGQTASVICGGLRHPDHNPNPKATLRYKYERHADCRRAAQFRSQAPYDRLSTFNLLVHRDVFMHVRFDEHITQYGYEDVLFATQLEAQGIPILHIDNPLLHTGLEANSVFLNKTETALRTALTLQGQLGTHSHVATTATRLQHLGLAPLVRLLYRSTKPLLRRNLLSSHPSLTLFSLYKLGYYLTLTSAPLENKK